VKHLDKRNAWRNPRVAAEYETRRFHHSRQRRKHRHDVALVLSLLERFGGIERVLDMPTGTGRLLPALGAAGFTVVGADISLEMMRAGGIATPPSGPLPPLAQVDGEHLPFATDAFDAALCMRFLFHVGDPGIRRRILREFARVARSLVIVQVRYRSTFKHAARWARSRVGLCRRYRPSRSRDALAREFDEAGLELLRLVPVSRLFSDKALLVARPKGIEVGE
jgi:ubiquinone/menaquinone biosynthesis C-methylase UbiE